MRSIYTSLLVMIAIFPGCKQEMSFEMEQQPRPVSVVKLNDIAPKSNSQVTGVAGAWKTEEIGFEVNGRIEMIIEPDRDVIATGAVDENGKDIATLIAKIDKERLELAVASAAAQVEIAITKVEASKFELDQQLPAQRRAAESDENLARTRLERLTKLKGGNAISDIELEEAQAGYDSAKEKVAQIKASLLAKAAEVKSLDAQVNQAKQQKREADRNLSDAELYSAIPGQIAEIHVVQGSVVTAGQPVATIQMMDPIKIEVEISADQSRKLNYRDVLPVTVRNRLSNEEQDEEGFVYMTDTFADPLTRTYTLTLLTRNSKTAPPVPEFLKDKPYCRSADIWRINFDFLPGALEKQMFAEIGSIHQDGNGDFFVFKVLNRKVGERATAENRVMQVSKVRVQVHDKKIPFLGNWTFQHIEPFPGETLDPAIDMVVGEIKSSDSEEVLSDFDGEFILLEKKSWMIRPGDLVQVDLSSESSLKGIYIPPKAIVEKNGKEYIFRTEDGLDQFSSVQQLEVTPVPNSKSRYLTPSLPHDVQIVVGGVHNLTDGETVRIVEVQE